MTWSRGFFRLWLVLAVAWAFISLYSANHSIDPIRGPVPKGCETAETEQDCSTILTKIGNPDPYASLERNPAYAAERRARAAWPWGVAVGWPLAVLALGVVLRWVLLGFRRKV